MKTRNILYWAATGLVAAAFTAGGFANVTRAAPVVATLDALGYPAYLASILGVCKLLGALALVAPGLPRLKEWAYAGIVFNMAGAVVSHLFVGDAPDTLLAPVILMALALISWALRPESRMLGRRLATFASLTPAREGQSLSTPA